MLTCCCLLWLSMSLTCEVASASAASAWSSATRLMVGAFLGAPMSSHGPWVSVMSCLVEQAPSRSVTSTPDPNTFKSVAMYLPFLSRCFCESKPSFCWSSLYTDAPPICTAMVLQKYWGQGSLEHPKIRRHELRYLEADERRCLAVIQRKGAFLH